MTTLREKKKERTRKKIQEASLQLFETLGYEKTTMEKIASEVEIGVGTLYNYFSSKSDLFFSIIEDNLEAYISDFEKIINSEMSLKESLNEFYDIYLKSFTSYSETLWRAIFGEIMLRNHRGYSKIKEVDKNFVDEIYKLLCSRRKEVIGISTDEKFLTLAKTLYSVLGFNIINFLLDNTISLQEMKDSLGEQVNLIVDRFCGGL